jgi:outer membrane protein OmpA-like peptidoglycan-associated protein
MKKQMIVVTLTLLMSCKHKPPTNSVWQNRQSINSAETAARLAFCAELGVADLGPEEPEEPASVPVVEEPPPVIAPPPLLVPVKAAPPPSYVMRVGFAKGSSLFKPNKEQVEELNSHLKGASRIEVRVRTEATQGTPADEKIIWSRALAAKDFLLAQGVKPEGVWLNVLPVGGYLSENITPEGQAENRRVEIEVFGGVP